MAKAKKVVVNTKKKSKKVKRLHEEPAWRWLRAQELVEQKQSPNRWHDDDYVQRAYTYLMKVDKNNPRTMREASRLWPTMHDAFRVWDAENSGKGSKWIFEAGVVADVPVETLSEYLQIDERTLKLYEKLFFDVRHMLDHPGWVNANLLHVNQSEGVSKDDPDHAWKEIALNGGWDILRSYWEVGNSSASVQDFMVTMLRHKIMKTGLSAVSAAQINSFNVVDMIRIAFDLMKHDTETGAQVARDKTQSSMADVLRSVKLTVVSALDKSPRIEPRRQATTPPQLPPPDIFETSRRTKADDEISKLAEATIEEVKKDG